MGRVWARLRWFEVGVALLGGVAFVAIGPCREVFTEIPGILFLGTLVLFMAPGVLATRWFLDEYFSGAALLPTGFVISAGTFALLGLPILILQSSLEAYLWVSGTVVAASLLAAALVAVLAALYQASAEPRSGSLVLESGGLLWVPFLALVGVLTYCCRIYITNSYGDIWVYLSWVREFLGGGRLAIEEPFFGSEVGLSRIRLNGWLLEQAAFSRVSGVEPVELIFTYLSPTLTVVALLAFYTLARTLFENEKAALICGCVYALFLLINLDDTTRSFGGEFISRIAEDKLATKFLFLPVALAIAVAFLKGGRWRYFWGFAFVCCAVITVHPVGLAVIGVSMAGFAILHLAVRPRSRVAWARISTMGLAGIAAVAVPGALLYALTGESLTAALAESDMNSYDPQVLRYVGFVRPEKQHIFELGNGLYIMHPSLLLDPPIAAAFLLGSLFLLRHLGQRLSAQLLLGAMYFTAVLVYVPQIATFMGDKVVLPVQLWRLAWPIHLTALLTLGWLTWEATNHARARLGGFGLSSTLARALPLLLVVALTVAAAPRAMAGVESVQRHEDSAQSKGLYPADPIYPWFHEKLDSPTVVLAPEPLSIRLPAYSPESNVVSYRGGLILPVLPELERRAPGRIELPRGAVDVQKFFSGASLEERMEILRHRRVDYVMVPANSSLNETMDNLADFVSLEEPSDRYNLYAVDLQKFDRSVEDLQ